MSTEDTASDRDVPLLLDTSHRLVDVDVVRLDLIVEVPLFAVKGGQGSMHRLQFSLSLDTTVIYIECNDLSVGSM